MAESFNLPNSMFGGPGQPRRPRFDQNNVVHVLASGVAAVETVTTTKTTSTTATTTNPHIGRRPVHTVVPELLPGITWRITSLDVAGDDLSAAATTGHEHMYTLTPTSMPAVKVPESALVSAGHWKVGDDVVKKTQPAFVCRVMKVQLALKKDEAGGGTEIMVAYDIIDELGTTETMLAEEELGMPEKGNFFKAFDPERCEEISRSE